MQEINFKKRSTIKLVTSTNLQTGVSHLNLLKKIRKAPKTFDNYLDLAIGTVMVFF